MTGEDVLPEKDLLEKAATMKIVEYSSLGKESKTQTSVVEKQYRKLNEIFESDDEEETIEKEEPVTFKKENLKIIHEPETIWQQI